MSIFLALGFFNDPEISESLAEDLCSVFLRPEKIHRPQLGLNPRTLDLEASTLPRDHRNRLGDVLLDILHADFCSSVQDWFYVLT